MAFAAYIVRRRSVVAARPNRYGHKTRHGTWETVARVGTLFEAARAARKVQGLYDVGVFHRGKRVEEAVLWKAELDEDVRARRVAICAVCDRPTGALTGKCTNGACGSCHARYCTGGGSTSPGHGLNVENARRLERARKERES